MEPDMSDILVSVPESISKAAFEAVAKAGGFWQPEMPGPRGSTVTAKIIKQGQLSNGSTYFFNDVGAVLMSTGGTINGPMGPMPEMAPIVDGLGNVLHWARIVVNGPFSPGFPNVIAVAQDQGCTVFLRWPIGENGALVWSSDGGATPANLLYLDTIGVMS
jgi:hypothetical protein